MLTSRGWKVLILAGVLIAGGIALHVKTDVFHVVSPRALAAMAVHDGQPVILLSDCTHYRIALVRIAPTPGEFDHPDPAHRWSVRLNGLEPGHVQVGYMKEFKTETEKKGC